MRSYSMRKIIFILLVASFLVSGCTKGKNTDVKTGFIPVKVGNPANDFLYNDVDQKPFMLSQQRGKIVIIYFLTLKCKECTEAMTSLDALNRKFGNKGLVVFAVDAETSQSAPMYELNKFIQKNSFSFRVMRDDDGFASEAFEVMKAPEAFIINKKGVIVSIVDGKTDWMSAENVKTVQSLLAED